MFKGHLLFSAIFRLQTDENIPKFWQNGNWDLYKKADPVPVAVQDRPFRR
jgi:hypothetical protein